jgi:hypothetical protein
MLRRFPVALLASLVLLLATGIGLSDSFPALAQSEPPAVSQSVPPVSIDHCPPSHPIKGNRAGRDPNRPIDPIYHVPGSRYYDVTDPEECFATVTDAEAAGYRAPLR